MATSTTPAGSTQGQPPPPPHPSSPGLSLTRIFSRVFSLLDGLNCWREMSPQLRRLISLNPSVFAGAIIARAAICPTPTAMSGGGGREELAAGATGAAVAAGAPPLPKQTRNPELGATMDMDVDASAAVDGDGSIPSVEAIPGSGSASGGGGGSNQGREGVGFGVGVGIDSGRDSWWVVTGETLAAAMPDVARGQLRGAPSCCAVAGVGGSDDYGDDAGSLPDFAFDAACSPLPLMARALRDVVGVLDAARMVRKSFGWIVRGEGDMAETATSTMEQRERRLDQLGSLMWTLGEFRRSLLLYEEGAASGQSRLARGGGDPTAAGGDGGGGGGVTVSYMRLVIEEIQKHIIRTLEAAAMVALPPCPYPSFRMDSNFVCEHSGWRCDAEGEEGDRGCVTCSEVLRPFLDNPHECWTSWVPWAGVEAGEVTPAFYRRLGLQCSVVGDAVKVREGAFPLGGSC